MNQPLISIIIPTHNEARWIKGCIESFLKQTYTHFEIIVVDDASTDRTVEIVKQYPQVALIRHNESKGEAATRNRGVQASTGEIILQTDADAIYPQNFLETALKYFEEYPNASGIAVGEVKIHPEQHGLIADYYRIKRRASYLARLKGKKPVVGCIFMKRDVFTTIGFYDEAMTAGTDTDFALRMKEKKLIVIWGKDLYFEHADPTSLWLFMKRMWNGSVYIRPFEKKWGRAPRGFSLLILLVRNCITLGIILFLLASLSDISYLYDALILFSIETFIPLIFFSEQKTMWLLALQKGKPLLFLLTPLFFFIQITLTATGKLYALIFKNVIASRNTFDI